jgi:hypothetical protein
VHTPTPPPVIDANIVDETLPLPLITISNSETSSATASIASSEEIDLSNLLGDVNINQNNDRNQIGLAAILNELNLEQIDWNNIEILDNNVPAVIPAPPIIRRVPARSPVFFWAGDRIRTVDPPMLDPWWISDLPPSPEPVSDGSLLSDDSDISESDQETDPDEQSSQ